MTDYMSTLISSIADGTHSYSKFLESRHFGSYQQSKLSVTQNKARYSAVKSNQL